MSRSYHTPVLLKACIDLLNITPSGTYVDITFGGGGHSKAILDKLNDEGRLFGFDQDLDAKRNVPADSRFTLIDQNFRYLKKYLRLYGVVKVNGILGDLGVSSHQFDEASRGFSTRFDAALDMRMSKANPVTAGRIVNEYSQSDLANVLRNFGELTDAKKLSAAIVEHRSNKKIETTGDLKTAIGKYVPRYEEQKYLARVFQALRIEVNQEMDALKECLGQCVEVLNSGGRLVIISYHSLEDRMVKNLMRTGNAEGKEEKDVIYGTGKKYFRLVGKQPIMPDDNEIGLNPRARSARLRAAEKL